MAHIKALLLDLDDTLLINDMEAFAPHYYEALLAHVSPVCPPARFIEALRAGTRAMLMNDGTQGTNAEVFATIFFSLVGCERSELWPLLNEFYAHHFEALRTYTAVDPIARRVVALALSRGYQLAIATQPLFPLVAIEARLRWADVGVEEFAYDYVSSYETMSACKPNALFFQALCERLGRAPHECLMVGDSAQADMPAGRLGIKTFWVQRGPALWLRRTECDAKGSLSDLLTLIETGRIHEL